MIDNYVLSIQDVSKWSVSLSRVIDVLSSTNYMIKCPPNYTINLEELNVNDEIVKANVISEDYNLTTSIVTKKLKLTIEHVSKKDYDTLYNDLFYKYLSSKTDSNVGAVLTNMVFDNTKNLSLHLVLLLIGKLLLSYLASHSLQDMRIETLV